MNNSKKIYNFISLMPKAELHVHLEGVIKPEMVFKLAQKNKIQLPVNTETELINFFKFKDFPHFVKVFTLISSCIKTQEDFELIAYEFGRDRAQQNIFYTEVNISIATDCKLTGLSWQQILEGLNKGRVRAKNDFNIELRWILDVLRDNPETQDLVREAVLNSKNDGVVAMGLSGQENLFDSSKFIETFAIVHKNNIGIVPHAGEIGDVKSMWDVINNIHANRIGHGVKCTQDPKMIELLKQKQIPLEICPTSNLRIGLFKDYKSHPLRKLWNEGLFVTINSDDPALFNSDLTNEYKILVDQFNFKIEDLEKVSLNAIRASFMPDEQKQEMITRFKAEFERLRNELGI